MTEPKEAAQFMTLSFREAFDIIQGWTDFQVKLFAIGCIAGWDPEEMKGYIELLPDPEKRLKKQHGG